MSTLCKASDRKLAHDADKVAKRLDEGCPVFQCKNCHRLSHKEEHLCKPVTVRVVADEVVPETLVEASTASETCGNSEDSGSNFS